ncbi:MAG: ABC transporter permease [Sciscionella sp.]
MTTATMTAPVARATVQRAPLGRLLRAELRWIFRRPRTLIALGLLALVPLLVAIGIKVAGPSSSPAGIVGVLLGNGFALPVVVMMLLLQVMLPLVAAMSAADAIAGESANGTWRGLLLAPIGKVRLFGIKATGVLAVSFAATAVITVSGVICGFALLGSNGLLTLSGSTLGVWAALGRVGLALLWVTVQVFAIGAIALAISASTEHPLVVMAATLAGLIALNVVQQISTLDWLHPYLITQNWTAVIDLLRDPVPTGSLWAGLARGGCYLVIGLSVALARTVSKEG